MSTFSNDDVAWPEDAVEVGRILDAWGIKGEFKVLPFSSDPKALFSSRRWFLKPAEVTAQRPAVPRAGVLPAMFKITSAREHGDVVVARAQEVPDRTTAESLKGVRIFVSRQSFPTAGPDEFYWIDLIGLTVINREGVTLGVVADLLDTGPHCVLRIRPEGVQDEAQERLVPFVAAYIDGVDLAARLINVDWGLDY
jgi:16S rRNA processing protein RimM